MAGATPGTASTGATMLSGGDIFLIVIALLAWRLVRAIEDGRDQLANVAIKLRYLEKRVDALVDGRAPSSASDKSDTASEDDPAVASMRGSSRPLALSASEFRECLLGDGDVDVERFMASCTEFSKLLGRMGSFARLLTREVRGNVSKINGTYSNNPGVYRSARALLEGEKNNGMHKEGGVLADPSGAMGMLWARRGLLFWATAFEGLAESEEAAGPDAEPSSVPVKKVAGAAYDEVLRQFNGWMTRSSFSMAINHMPDWNTLNSNLGPSREEVAADMRAWAAVTRDVVDRLKALHTEYDLEDTRKSL